jgi:hypothetical protein
MQRIAGRWRRRWKPSTAQTQRLGIPMISTRFPQEDVSYVSMLNAVVPSWRQTCDLTHRLPPWAATMHLERAFLFSRLLIRHHCGAAPWYN